MEQKFLRWNKNGGNMLSRNPWLMSLSAVETHGIEKVTVQKVTEKYESKKILIGIETAVTPKKQYGD